MPEIMLTIWCPVCWFKDTEYPFDPDLFGQTMEEAAAAAHSTASRECKGPVRIKRNDERKKHGVS